MAVSPEFGADADVFAGLAAMVVGLEGDRAALQNRAHEVQALSERWKQEGTLTRAELVLIAVNLHAWYTGLEVAFDRTAGVFALQSEATADVNRSGVLAKIQMQVRHLVPALVTPELAPRLHELRKFQHAFRQAYDLDLDLLNLRAHADDLLAVCTSVHAGLGGLAEQVAQALESLEG